jgi:hypothetical protein
MMSRNWFPKVALVFSLSLVVYPHCIFAEKLAPSKAHDLSNVYYRTRVCVQPGEPTLLSFPGKVQRPLGRGKQLVYHLLCNSVTFEVLGESVVLFANEKHTSCDTTFYLESGDEYLVLIERASDSCKRTKSAAVLEPVPSD